MGRQGRLRPWLFFGLWCAIVGFGLLRHEYWRDEARAFSFARDSKTLGQLFARLTDEGHPLLWYLLLYGGHALTGSRWVLPIVSFVVAAAAVGIFVFRCPLPWWLKALFVFGGLPLYEYSVVARNYGISMLLMFAFAALYPRRARNPLALGLVLACLANTNIHSIVLASLLMALWLWDALAGGSRARPVATSGSPTPRARVSAAVNLFAAAFIFVAGIVAALATVWPTDQILTSDPSRYTASHAWRALGATLRDPASEFQAIVPRVPGVFATAILANVVFVGATVGLAARPALISAAWAAVLALSVLFEVVYRGGYRHQGLFLVFLLTLYWLLAIYETPSAAPASRALSVSRRVGLGVCLPIVLSISLVTGTYKLGRDIARQQSASRAFASFLRAHPEHAGAILVGEPDFALESVAFYIDQPIYIVRERRFGDTVSFTKASAIALGLGDLLHEARTLQKRERREVLIALGHLKELLDPARAQNSNDPRSPVEGFAQNDVRTIRYGYGRTFSWSPVDLRAWQEGTEVVARFAEGIVGDEQYVVYRLK